jgi:hypothetical protein
MVRVLAVNSRSHHPEPMPQCSAIGKVDGKTLICDLPHGHDGDHAAFWGAQKITWPQEVW